MSGVGAFIVGAAVGAVVAKKATQKHHHDKHHHHHHHQYQTSRTVVVHQPPQQVPHHQTHHQTHLVYVNNPPAGPCYPQQGYPHGAPSGYPPGHAQQGYPQVHQPPHYTAPQPQPPPPVYHQSAPQSPGGGYPPPIGFVGSQSPHGPPPLSSYPPSVGGGYPPAPQYDGGYPPHQAPGYPPAQSGYPSGGYPPMSGASSSQYPPLAPHPPPSVCPFQPPSAHPPPASATQPQVLQAQVTVQLTSNQQNYAAGGNTARPDRRCFVLQNEETRYALQVDTASGSRLVMRQRTATGSWDPQWSSGQGQAQCQGQLWYFDGEGIIRSQLNDFVIEIKDAGSWLGLAPYSGDSRQQWIVRDGRILSNRASPNDCIGLEEGLMGTAVNADVIVTKYQARRHHHWVVEYI